MRKSRAATTTPLRASGSLMAASLVRLPLHQAPPWRSTIIGKGPAPFGRNNRARRGRSPCRRYSRSSTVMSCMGAPLGLVLVLATSAPVDCAPGRPRSIGGSTRAAAGSSIPVGAISEEETHMMPTRTLAALALGLGLALPAAAGEIPALAAGASDRLVIADAGGPG